MAINRQEAMEKLARLRNKHQDDIANRNKSNFKGKSVLNLSEHKDISFFNPEEDGRKIKDGVYSCSIDIIPFVIGTNNHPNKDLEKGDFDYVLDYFQHGMVGINDDRILCPKRTYGKPCPICEDAERLKKEGASKEEVSQLYPQWKVLYNIDDHNGGVKLFSVSRQTFHKVMMEELSVLEASGDEKVFIADLKNGRTVSFRATESKFMGRKFYKYSNFSFKERKEYRLDILDKAISLDSLLTLLDYNTIKNSYFGIEDEGNDDNIDEMEVTSDEYDDSKIKSKKNKKQQVYKEEEELDDDIEEEEEEIEEEEESDTNIEEEEIEEEEEEEEEIVAPPKKKLHAKKSMKQSSKSPMKGKENKASPESKKESGKCPYGYIFGKDYEYNDECGDCNKKKMCEESYEEEYAAF